MCHVEASFTELALSFYFYYVNFGPLSRGTAATGALPAPHPALYTLLGHSSSRPLTCEHVRAKHPKLWKRLGQDIKGANIPPETSS